MINIWFGVNLMTEKEFLQLLSPLESYLKRMALAIVGDKDEAQDALQEALLAAFVARDQLRDKEYFKPWVKKIVAHQCGRQLKKPRSVIPMGRGGEYPLEQEDRRQKVDESLIWEVVKALPEPLARVVTLRYMADLPQKEIAKILAIPEGTVKSRLHKALSDLRQILSAEQGGKTNEVPTS